MSNATVGSDGANPAPRYYNPNAPITRPVTIIQVETFVPREGMYPSLVLADGSHYFGPVVEDHGYRIPCGCGIMLFQYDETVKPNLTTTAAAAASAADKSSSRSNTGGFTSFFFGRGIPQGGGASQAVANLTAACKRYRQGDRYGGDWANGTFHGDGALVTSTFTYHGTWKEGQMQGKGTISYTRKYVDHRPSNASGSGSGDGVSSMLLKGLSYVSPFDLVAGTAAPKEYIGDFDAKHYRHGMGLMQYYNGDVYEGEWYDNCRHGRGKLRKMDGEVYDGDWAFDQRHGNGKIMYPNGSVFKGSMEYDQRNGEGVMRFANGDEFFGSFKKDRIDGHGTMRYRNGDVYEGSWRDQLRHGQGKYTLKRTGATMHGEFQSGLIHGEGTVVVPGVSTFVGIFVRGERTIGTMHWHQQPKAHLASDSADAAVDAAGAAPSGCRNVSPLIDAPSCVSAASPPPPRNSTSSAAAASPSPAMANKASTKNYLCYQGKWHGEHMHGRGLLWYTNGDFYAGNFHKSLRHGAGNMRYAAEQAEYSGQYVHGVRHGLGLLQRANKSIQAGRWQQNVFVEGYEGEWDGTAFHGIGRLTIPVDTFFSLRSSNSAPKRPEVSATPNDGFGLNPANASGIVSDEEGRSAADNGEPLVSTSTAGSSSATAGRADLPPLFIDFVGLFRNGLRDGPGLLKLPALDGLVGSSLNLSEERKSGGSGGQRGSASGGDESNAAAGASRTRNKTMRLAPVPSMIVKGRWVREVLHCDRGVWAFPSGIVYIGRFLNGHRDAARACVWWPDGSVLESGWRSDAPSGVGIWHRRNRTNPVYRTVYPNMLHRLPAQRPSERVTTNSPRIDLPQGGGHGVSEAAAVGGGGTGGDLAGDLIGDGASRAGDGDGGADEESKNLTPRRVLVDFSNHFTFLCSWSPRTVDLSTYASVMLPQIGMQTAPLPGGTPWPQLHHSPSMSVALGAQQTCAVETAKSGRGAQKRKTTAAPPTVTGSIDKAPPSPALWPVPTAKQLSACAKSLHVAETLSSVTVARASGPGVVYFESGVVLSGEWLGNVPRLAVPFRPWSAFDEFIRWQASRAASRNCANTVPCLTAPRLQSCYTSVLESAPEDVSGEPRRFTSRRMTVVLSPLDVGRDSSASGQEAVSSTPPLSLPSPDLRCTFCAKDYSFFRKRLHCTLCLRSSCSSCLGTMDTEGLAHQEDVEALLRHAYVTAEQTVQLSAAAAAKTSLGDSSCGAAHAIHFPSLSAAQVDQAFDKGVSAVPVCADCVRAVLWKLRYTQLWIPMTMFASVVEGDKHQCEVLRNNGAKAVQRDSDSVAKRNGAATGDLDDGFAEAAETPATVAHSHESSQDHCTAGEALGLSPSGHAASTKTLDAVTHPRDTDVGPTGNSALRSSATASSSDAALAGGASLAFTAKTEGAASVEAGHDPLVATPAEGAATTPLPLPPSSPIHSEKTPPRGINLLPSTQYIIYSGYTSHTIPHVYGELWWGRRYYYRGGFRAGERHGFGTQYMPNGEWYEGGFERDAWHGQGVYHLEDGSVLLGEFLKGKLHALRYHGEVKESEAFGVQPHGRGIGYSPDGSIYNGEWVHGRRHGTGMLYMADGSSVYSGTFVSDAMEGMGKLVTTSGAYYGDFHQNKQNGKGLLFTTDCVVEGSWKHGTSSGFTRIYERDTGEVYETTYCDGNERDDCFVTPVIVEDNDASECGQCGTAFSFFLRRHHCRLCGDVFCDACTQHRATLPASVTGNGGSGAKSDTVSPSASAVSGQQFRVCDACFLRLSQRRMIALRRYADGSVYAGCWSQRRWVSRGLYCRPDGLFVVMDTHGHALLPMACVAKAQEEFKDDANGNIKEPSKPSAALPASGFGAARRSLRASGLPPSPSILQDAAPAKELLDSVSESSARKDLDAFLLWWATTRSRCGLQVALDISLVSHYQRMPAQMLRGKEATVKAGSDIARYLATPARGSLETPHTPSLAPIRLFVTLAESQRSMRAMVEGEVERTCADAGSEATAAANGVESRLSTEEKRTMDSDVEAAALRAARFMPVAIPRAPVVPVTAATVPVASAAERPAATAKIYPGDLHHACQMQGADSKNVFGLSSWVTRPPPSIDAEDISDEALMEMMQTERLSWPTAAKDPESVIPPLMPPTPAPPTPGLNTMVPWDVWAMHDVPRYAPPPLTAVAAAATSTAGSSVEEAAGGDDGASAEPPPAPRGEADMYFACPFWSPTVPDAQLLLEQGKATQASELMRRLQEQDEHGSNPQPHGDVDGSDGEASGCRCVVSTGGEGKARGDEKTGNPLRVLQSTQGRDSNASVPSWEASQLFSPEQRARSGRGWAPEPMHGPFVFDISDRDMCRSADGQRCHPKVTQREVPDF
ncbi:hypothetical protein JKF63_04169 [Porcisia hertigi]|uniref:FYVE-type domain-containing protein n=1 Tax=Porcisia hertigi TaxID=2761500 RepID=A0A836HZ58_9TRYP|nr:hypothetical protein JKF63_04169 [Porcisia hertigi]